MTVQDEFKHFATRKLGLNSNTLHHYISANGGYVSPTIIEERQLNVAQMDVFSRLMMDRIIFLGRRRLYRQRNPGSTTILR